MPLNEYDALLTSGQAPDANEYDALLNQERDLQKTALRQAIYSATATPPDTAARALDHAERLNLPRGTVERNLPLIERQAAVARNDYDKMLDELPVLTHWLAESPDNAAVAHDDLDQLGAFEALSRAASTGFRHGRHTAELGRRGYDLAAGDRTPENLRRMEALERDLTAAPQGRGFSARILYPAAKFVGQILDTTVKSLEPALAGASAGAATAAIAGQLGPQVALPEEVVTVPAAAALGFRAGLGAGYVADVYTIEAGHAYLELSRARARGGETIDEETKQAAAVGVGFINAALEYLGIKLVMAPWKAAAKKFVAEGTTEALAKPTVRRAVRNFGAAYATAIAGEVSTEVLQESTNILAEELAKLVSDGEFERLGNSPAERDAAIERLFDTASETFRGMLLVGLPGASINLTADLRHVQRARENEKLFTALGTAAEGSKLRTRLPAKFQEFVARATADGPVENVYIPAEAFATYFQGKALDPRQVATELLGSPEAYDLAVQTGEDLRIPTGAYAAKLAGTEHHAALVPDLKLAPEQMTPREAEAFLETIKAEADTKPAGAETTGASVREDVLGQLLGLGYERATAEAYADLYDSTFRTLGQRAGVDPFALYARYGLKIDRPLPEVLRKFGDTDALDVLIDRLRKGDVPTDRDVFGPSLLDFLVTQGGIQDQGGELAARDAARARRGLVREGGRTLDDLAEVAVQAGYLDVRDPHVLLDRIDAELRGERVSARGQENPQLAEVRATLEQLDQFLGQMGVDVKTTENPVIKELLRGLETPAPAAQELVAGAPVVEYNQQQDDATTFYQKDLFGDDVPDPPARPRPARQAGNVQPAVAVRALEVEDETTGHYAVETALVSERSRTLPIDNIATPDDAARAFAYLSDYAVEHFDALVTDAAGRPLAIAAAFKGTIDGTAVYPNTMLFEIFRVKGAANVWLSHNHPSGDPSFSRADELLFDRVLPKFEGTGVRLRGLFAMGRETYQFQSPDKITTDGVIPPRERDQVAVPIVERVFTKRGELEAALTDPRSSMLVVPALAKEQSGIVLLNNRHVPIGFYPVTAEEAGALRTSGRLDRLYRALSKTNAAAAIIANPNGALKDLEARNLGSALGSSDVRVLDIIGYRYDPETQAVTNATSESEHGRDVTTSGREFSQRVFHGSPHVFEKFSIQKIGTGEGAAAFGWGLYFATKKDVANFYRSVLAPSADEYRVDGKVEFVVDQRGAPFDVTAPRKRAIYMLATMKPKDIQKWVQEVRESPHHDRSWMEQFDKALGELKNKKVERIEKTDGRLYEVELADEAIDNMLHWDKKLSEQSPAVRDALRRGGLLQSFNENKADFSTPQETRGAGRGHNLYAMLVEKWRARDPENAAQRASEELSALGIAGIKYLDAGSRGRGRGSLNFVVFDERAVEIIGFEQRAADAQRGSIRISPDRTINVNLFERADLSTFLHETGHFYLEVLGDLATGEFATGQPIAPELVRDYQTILDWLGVKSRDEIKTEHHEQFARGFEAYLREGKAPNAGLRQAFAKFRAWLVAIYRSITQLDVKLTDEVRAVMDRLIATEEEIAAAQSEAEVVPLFADAKRAGMTDVEFAAYREIVETANVAARDRLQTQLLAQVKRETEAWWKGALAKKREEVAKEIDKQPAYRAAALLDRGTQPDGSPLPEGLAPFKLDRKAITAAHGKDFAKRLRRYAENPGGDRPVLDPDAAAEILGFANGEELLLALTNLRPREELLDAEALVRLREEHGDLMLDGTKLAAEAQRALHGDERAKVIAAEIAALRRQQRAVAPFVRAEREKQATERRAGVALLRGSNVPSAQIRAMAEGIIAQRRVREIQPGAYLVAMRRAARAAVEAAGKDEYAVAAAAKQRELLNLELYRAARDALDDTESIADYLGKFTKDKARAKLGQAGADYLDQVDGLLERFEFKRASNRALDRRAALAEWIREKEAAGETAGEEFVIPPRLMDEAYRINYRSLSVEELRGLRDAVKQIEQFARLKNKLLAAAKEQDRETAKAELLDALEKHLKDRGPPPLTKAGLSRLERLGAGVAKFDASLLKMEQIVDWLDGGDLTGPWHRYLWDGAAAAQAAELDYSQRITAKIAHAVMNIPKDIRARMLERVAVPGVERIVTRKDLIGVALNVGNQSNYDKLLKGMGWTPEQVQEMVDRLTPEEIAFVNSIHETLESMWPDIAKLQKDLTGLAPEKIEPRPFVAQGGTIKGGYYPIMYDPLASQQGQLQLAARVGGLLEDTYTRATTPKGHTKARVTGFAAPFNLDIDDLTGHVAGVVKDLTHRKWLLDANWLVHDRQIRAALRQHLGDAYVGMFPDWVRSVINDRNFASLRSLNIWRRSIEHLRYNILIAAMGFKAASMMSQFAGLGPAIEIVGTKHLRRGFAQVVRHPAQSYRLVTELSGEMRHRLQTRDRDLRDKLRLLEGREDFLAKLQDAALRGIAWADMMVSLPTWLGAYHKTLEAGQDTDTAVKAGDRAVRLSQGAGGAKDLAAVMARNDSLMRIFTMFYTPFNALYNRMRDVGRSVGGIRDVPQAAVRLWWVWLVPAVLGELLGGHGPDEDEELDEWALKAIALYPSLGIPVLRDVIGGAYGDFGYQLSPVAQVGESVARTLSKAKGVATGDAELEDLAKSALRTSGFLIGLPTGQIQITGGYLADLAGGDAEPDNLGEFARDLLYRRRE